MDLPSSSLSLSPTAETIRPPQLEDVHIIRLFFRLFGLRVNAKDSNYLIAYNAAVLTSMFAGCIFQIISMFTDLDREKIFQNSALVIFTISCCIGYLNLSYSTYRGVDLFSLMIDLAAPDTNELGRNQLILRKRENTGPELKTKSTRWVLIASIFALGCHTLIFIAHGDHPESYYYDVNKSVVWSWLNILFLYYNISWLFPVAIVVLCSSFFQQRLLIFAEYLESEKACNIDIRNVMVWYSELYDANMKMTIAISPIVTQFIVFNLPLLVLLLQVSYKMRT